MLAVVAEAALRSLLIGGAVWTGLYLFRVRNPHVHMTSWLMVLLASLSMPLLMRCSIFTITLQSLPAVARADGGLNAASLWPIEAPSGLTDKALHLDMGNGVAPPQIRPVFDWWTFATAIYALVAGLFLARFALGLGLTWRLARAARSIDQPWAAPRDVRVSAAIKGPVTFGSTILLPPQYTEWDALKRHAVMAHESAHVARGDFYVLLLASFNRAIFWFSPLAWWQLIRLAELAEIISDARALEGFEDRLSYAEILLDLVQVQRIPAALEMARASTLRARVERILDDAAVPASAGLRKRIWTAAVIAPVVSIAAGTIAYNTTPEVAPVFPGEARTAGDALDSQSVEFYSFGPSSIFTLFRQADDLYGQLTWQRKLHLSAQHDVNYAYPAEVGQISFATGGAQHSEPMFEHNGSYQRGILIAEASRQNLKVDDRLLDSYVGWYQLSPYRVLSITRDGNRMQVQETGRSKFEVAAYGKDAFSGDQDEFVMFLRDNTSEVSQVVLQEPLTGARQAPRVPVARAKAIEEAFARRIADAPDRFRAQTPDPASKETILRGIEEVRDGHPNYKQMSAALAAKTSHQAKQIQSMLKTLGAVQSIFFRGVGPGGYDIYGLKFANGFAEVRLLLGAGGLIEDATFRPDGNGAPGDVLSCSREADLRSKDDTAPIKVFLYNSSGRDIQLYRLNPEGKRMLHGTIGDNASSAIVTNVDNPWVLTDAAGQCMEIVLPGERTRGHTVEAPVSVGQSAWLSPRPRTAPLDGSEAMLRQYIEAVGRGQPNYERMTAEVAAQTRQELAIQQAILNKLGALRAVSFRGVNKMGHDMYMAYFDNGSAEWRIGLVNDGMIGRIMLGPAT
jgi:hypothetical protein